MGRAVSELDFDAKEFMSMSLKERAQRCRLLAARSLELSRLATNKDHKAAYVEISKQWLMLANEMDREGSN